MNRKLGKKRMDAFNKKVEKIVLALGGIRKSETRMEWNLVTPAGDLRISVHEPYEKNEAIFSIFTAFYQPRPAMNLLIKVGINTSNLNPYSGKFNYHISNENSCLVTFEMDMKSILKV